MKISHVPLKEIIIERFYEITLEEYIERFVDPQSYDHSWAHGLLLAFATDNDDSGYRLKLRIEKQIAYIQSIIFVRLPENPKTIKNHNQGIINIVVDESKDPMMTEIANWIKEKHNGN